MNKWKVDSLFLSVFAMEILAISIQPCRAQSIDLRNAVKEPYLNKAVFKQEETGSLQNLIIKVDSVFDIQDGTNVKKLSRIIIDTLKYQKGFLIYSSSSPVSFIQKGYQDKILITNFFYSGDTVKICSAVRKGVALTEMQCAEYYYTQAFLKTKTVLDDYRSVNYYKVYEYSNGDGPVRTEYHDKKMNFPVYTMSYEEGDCSGGNTCWQNDCSKSIKCIVSDLKQPRYSVNINSYFDKDNNEVFCREKNEKTERLRYSCYENGQLRRTVSVETEKTLGSITCKVKIFKTGKQGDATEYIYIYADSYTDYTKRKPKTEVNSEDIYPHQMDIQTLRKLRLREIIYSYSLVP